MVTIPVEEFKGMPYDDMDVIKAWEWFMSFIPPRQWEKRKRSIENLISTEFRSTPPFSEPISKGTAITIKDDKIGWYLYLVEMLIKEPYKYEYFQGARVVPIFKRFGMDFALLKDIGGVATKVRKLVHQRKSEADATLFEILTALLWTRNSWEVSFLEEQTIKKMPDILARNGREEWYIECKRQSKTSDYALSERLKWQTMISYLNKILLEHNLLLEIVFHVELTTLPDTFLKDLLAAKLPLVVQPGKVV